MNHLQAMPLRHPWLQPSMKRKLAGNDDDRPAKRRMLVLEQNLANLSLDAVMVDLEAEMPIIEEPVSPEITMKSSSWYEPEADRIVITDLAAYAEEELQPEEPPVVNTALIERLKSRPLDPPILSQSQSQALVLFRPLQLPPKTDSPRADNEDAMDVEP
ncbi:40S ribosomal protein [Mycena indigotica]|uniref:40S ribosomal protein n=1 Tax=Mycena indigotica TaxID=2126181 RepID=A0A8H6WK42_9AGAR|nr:40S ribosomal protein [Mycena indigotica]KAF7315324.1 40S ribosomal protein [Mycena indigotica]